MFGGAGGFAGGGGIPCENFLRARLAAAGGGITRLAAFVANDYLRRGELKELFTCDECTGFNAEIEPLDFYACVRDHHQLTPKVRAFMDYLVEALPAEWRAV